MKFTLLILIIAVGLLSPVGTSAVLADDVTKIVSLDASAGENPEALAVDADGNIYFGLAFTGEIRKLTPAGEVTSYANLPSPGNGFMVGMIFDDAGDLFVGMGSFDPETHGIWRVSPDGEAELFASLPVEGQPNGIELDEQGNMYVTDTPRGGIWKIDSTGNVSDWLNDDLLLGVFPTGLPGLLGFPIGANGIVFDATFENLYVAVTEFGRLVKIPVNEDGSAGVPEVFIEHTDLLLGMDGIVFGPDGNIYAAIVIQNRIISISPSGGIKVIAQGGDFQNPSDVKFGIGADSNTLYIANFAILRTLGLAPGDPEPAILKTTVNFGVGLPSVGDTAVPVAMKGMLVLGLIFAAAGVAMLVRRKLVATA